MARTTLASVPPQLALLMAQAIASNVPMNVNLSDRPDLSRVARAAFPEELATWVLRSLAQEAVAAALSTAATYYRNHVANERAAWASLAPAEGFDTRHLYLHRVLGRVIDGEPEANLARRRAYARIIPGTLTHPSLTWTFTFVAFASVSYQLELDPITITPLAGFPPTTQYLFARRKISPPPVTGYTTIASFNPAVRTAYTGGAPIPFTPGTVNEVIFLAQTAMLEVPAVGWSIEFPPLAPAAVRRDFTGP